MKIKQTANELVIQETPGCIWIFSSLFLFVGGVFIYGALGGFSNWSSAPFWTVLFTLLMGTIAFSVGAWLIFTRR